MDLDKFSVPVVLYANDEIILDENSLALQINNGVSSKGKHVSVLTGALVYTHTSRVIMSNGELMVMELVPLPNHERIGGIVQIEHELSAPILQLQTRLDKIAFPEEESAFFQTVFTTFKKKLQSITLEMSFRNGVMELNAKPCCDLPQMLALLTKSINLYYEQEIVVLDVHSPFASVKCDENKILFALLQLINNGIKMTPVERTPKIILSLIEEKDAVLLRVTDNGVGFSTPNPYHLTDAYVQGENPLNKPVQGLGIGLYLVRKIVELHGGVLSLENNVDLGATVTFSIPKDEESKNILNAPRLTSGFEEIKERVAFILVDVPIEKRDE